jgi:hypothetical protein
VFEFGKNRVPVYPATAAAFIAKFDFQTSLLLIARLAPGQAKIPGQFCTKRDFNPNPVYLIPTSTEFAGQANALQRVSAI